jgi:hypothetical protein
LLMERHNEAVTRLHRMNEAARGPFITQGRRGLGRIPDQVKFDANASSRAEFGIIMRLQSLTRDAWFNLCPCATLRLQLQQPRL